MSDTSESKSSPLVNAQQREAAKWEYTIVEAIDAPSLQDKLNEHAKAGWELVHYVGSHGSAGARSYSTVMRRDTRVHSTPPEGRPSMPRPE